MEQDRQQSGRRDSAPHCRGLKLDLASLALRGGQVSSILGHGALSRRFALPLRRTPRVGVLYRLFAFSQRLSPEIFHCSLLIAHG
jgi:hypothetical protein